MNLFTRQKQTHRHRKQTMVTKGERGVGRDKLGVWDQQIQTTIHNGKELKKNIHTYICITESLCCTSEANTTL